MRQVFHRIWRALRQVKITERANERTGGSRVSWPLVAIAFIATANN